MMAMIRVRFSSIPKDGIFHYIGKEMVKQSDRQACCIKNNQKYLLNHSDIVSMDVFVEDDDEMYDLENLYNFYTARP